MELLWGIKKKVDEIKTAKVYNNSITSFFDPINIKKMRLDLKELELEYNREKRNL